MAMKYVSHGSLKHAHDDDLRIDRCGGGMMYLVQST